MDLKERIAELVKVADAKNAEYYARQGFTFESPPKHTADYISDKWCRIVTNGTHQRSVYCFVALQDNYTKALGTVKAGDIHKAAGWKAPAKHARGNVFQENFAVCLTEHGAVYLS